MPHPLVLGCLPLDHHLRAHFAHAAYAPDRPHRVREVKERVTMYIRHNPVLDEDAREPGEHLHAEGTSCAPLRQNRPEHTRTDEVFLAAERKARLEAELEVCGGEVLDVAVLARPAVEKRAAEVAAPEERRG